MEKLRKLLASAVLIYSSVFAGTASAQCGHADLTWNAPSQNVDGTQLTDMAGFKVYWGNSPGLYPSSTVLSNPALRSYSVDQLVNGTYYFVVTAFNSSGVESAFSNSASKAVDGATGCGLLPGAPSQPPGITWTATNLPQILQLSPARYATGVLKVGAPVYVDRPYTWIDVVGLDGAAYVIPANDDKTSLSGISFAVSTPATVYVLQDARAAIPTWLAGWNQASRQAVAMDGADGGQRRVFSKSFSAGQVTLGPVGAAGSSTNVYTVAVAP